MTPPSLFCKQRSLNTALIAENLRLSKSRDIIAQGKFRNAAHPDKIGIGKRLKLLGILLGKKWCKIEQSFSPTASMWAFSSKKEVVG